MVSENSFHLQSQLRPRSGDMSIDSAGNSVLPQGLSQSKKHAASKPRFVEFACSHVEVFRYVMLVTKIVIPKQFWGCAKNLKLVQLCIPFALQTLSSRLTMHRRERIYHHATARNQLPSPRTPRVLHR
ncbi:hypothetical protein F5I97DRAFT_1811868 [Phlebopus sp. FC_14]|nr:hypothetical protein F5I97DRAFT_1811868 [Phlebopus sp. FC_14]